MTQLTDEQIDAMVTQRWGDTLRNNSSLRCVLCGFARDVERALQGAKK